MAALAVAEKAETDPIFPFDRAVACRHVTNFEGETLEQVAVNAHVKWGWEGSPEAAIKKFQAAYDSGLIVRRHRRHNKIGKGFRTLFPAEREAREIVLNGGRIPKKKRDLSAADCRKLARQSERARKKERLQAYTPLEDLIPVSEPVLVNAEGLRSKHPKWFRHPATDPLSVY
jgi:hypothetical protein